MARISEGFAPNSRTSSPDISHIGSSVIERRQNEAEARRWAQAAYFSTVFVRSEHTAPYPLERARRGQRSDLVQAELSAAQTLAKIS